MAEDWLSPLNRIIWMAAFRKKEQTVTLRDGRKFVIDYDRRPGEVFVKPAKGSGDLVPRGFFNLKKVTENVWLAESN